MLAWKSGIGLAAAALLVATAARAEETATVVIGAARAEGEATQNQATGGHATEHKATGHQATGGQAIAVALLGDYWLGLVASPASPALQSQLKLAKGQGLVVDELQAESPASKAGLKQYDVLLKGNDKPLTGLGDLQDLVNQVKGGNLKLDLLRGGKHETVTVTPGKRPAEELGGNLIVRVPAGDAWAPQPGLGSPDGTIRFRVIGPGQILPPDGPLFNHLGEGPAKRNFMMHIKSGLADGSKVEIIRNGAGPAKVTVAHDNDKWEGTADDLSKIPAKIRPEVEKLLQTAGSGNFFYAAPGALAAASAGPAPFGGAVVVPEISGTLAVSPEVEKRLSEMQKQIGELRHAVDALQGKTQTPKPKP